jgi:hypothetical protein
MEPGLKVQSREHDCPQEWAFLFEIEKNISLKDKEESKFWGKL